ncbi:MAG: hypothetical protein EOP20_01110 [Hyphomicrobiales bacterium]|nr:MAG: hypothetical protein EOP20_01110 [Hyphomicrobiales bacterium]
MIVGSLMLLAFTLSL